MSPRATCLLLFMMLVVILCDYLHKPLENRVCCWLFSLTDPSL